MNDFDKIFMEIELFVSKQFYMLFGQYRKSLNFLEPFMKSGRSVKKGRTFAVTLIVLYATIFVTCVGVFGWYYIKISGLRRETTLIESKINSDDEERLNAELEEAEGLRDYYLAIKNIYESDIGSVENKQGLTAEILEKLTDTDGLDVNLSVVAYTGSRNLVIFECEAYELTTPVKYIKSLKEKFPDANFEYTGYTVVNGVVKFSVQCHLPEQSEGD